MYTRYREKSVSTANQSSYKSLVDSQPVSGTIITTDARTMWDNKTPHYYEQLKDPSTKFLPVNPMMKTSQRGAYITELDYTENYKSANSRRLIADGPVLTYAPVTANQPAAGHLRYKTSWTHTSTPSLPDLDQLESWLVMEAIAKARSQAWDVLTFAMEFRKTLELFTKLGQRIDQRRGRIEAAIRRDKRFNAQNLRDPERLLAYQKVFFEMWMEYRYGWRILQYDLRSASNAAEQLFGKAKLERATTKDSVNRVATSVVSRNGCSWMNGNNVHAGMNVAKFTFKMFNEQSAALRVGIGMVGELDSPVYHDLLVTGWELTKFSFVIDRFIQIGDTLRSILPLLRGDVGYVWATRTVTSQLRTEGTAVLNPYWDPLTGVKPGLLTFQSTVMSINETVTRRKLEPELSLGRRLKIDPSFLLDIVAMLQGNSRHLRRSGR